MQFIVYSREQKLPKVVEQFENWKTFQVILATFHWGAQKSSQSRYADVAHYGRPA